MKPLTDRQLATMRRQAQVLMGGTVIIQVNNPTSDGAGGQVESWQAVGTVAGRIDPITQQSDSDVIVASREALAIMYRLTVPHDAPLEAHNRVSIGGRNYEIVNLTPNHTMNVSRRGIIKVVK